MHNPDTNEFEPLSEEEAKKPQPHPVFSLDQTFVLNGLTFRLHKIRKKEIVLRPVKSQPPEPSA